MPAPTDSTVEARERDPGPALALGPQLPTYDPAGNGLVNPAEAAKTAEELGFDIVFVGDHLAFNPPWLESLSCLAAASVSTDRIALGTSVLLAAMRQPAWLAKQIATLQHLSEGRLVLGVGVGGENPAEWEAAGVSPKERGRRTDAILAALPSMLAAKPTHIAPPFDISVPSLRPAAGCPSLWIGGRSDAALRRTARTADGWLGAFVDARALPERVDRLRKLAAEAERDPPRVGLSVFVNICGSEQQGTREARDYFDGLYKLPLERVRRFCLIGDADHVASGLAEYVEAGVSLFTIVPTAAHPYEQYEPLAEVRRMVFEEVAASPLALGESLGCWE
jgi:alkanesulfonate monooxygenase SsuD/methylene tetrahydromethanopterin reductase-like flavin-dependent oxidoreductase (luciferase family)